MSYYNLWYKQSRFSFISIHIMLVVSLCYGVFFGNKPFLCVYKNEFHCFVFNNEIRKTSLLAADLIANQQNDYRKMHYNFSLWPVFPVDPLHLNLDDAWKKPFSHQTNSSLNAYYFWGTADLGRDVLSSCFWGLRKGFLLAILSIGFSLLFSLLVMLPAGFQSSFRQKIALGSVCLILLNLMLVFYYLGYFLYFKKLSLAIHIFVFTLVSLLLLLSYYVRNGKPSLNIAFEKWGLVYIQLMFALPGLLFVLLLIQIFPKPDLITLSTIIAILYSPILMKYIRSLAKTEMANNLVITEESLGKNSWRIIFFSLGPRIIIRIFPILIFGLANILLLETSLSFLGLGMSVDEISLGALMAQSKSNLQAWWLILFPGLIIFWMVFSFNRFGDWLQKNASKELS